MFESYKEEVTFNEERGSEDFDPQNEFYQEDMEQSFKKDITSIGRRLIGYMLVFFFFAAAGQQGAAQNAVDTEDFYGIWGVGLFIAASLSFLVWSLSKKFPMKRIYEHVAPRQMNIQSFAILSASLFGVRFISKLLLTGLEKLLLEMGIPATLVTNTSEELTSSIIFVLYLGVMAPVVEEFIFSKFPTENDLIREKFLLEKNESEKLLAGFWHFPLIEVDEFSKDEELNLFNQVAEPSMQLGPSPQESFEQDYDLEVEWQDSHFEEVKHVFSHRKWHVRILSGQVVDSKEYSDKEVVWLTPEEFDFYPLAKPQQKIWQEYSKRC